LRLTTERHDYQGKSYSSGAVTSKDKFDYLFGRLDISARLSKGNGFWPAFWLLPTQTVLVNGWASHEVDMMEYLGQDPYTDYMVNWWGPQKEYCAYTGPDFSADFHLFTFIWTPTSLTWLIDGTQRCQLTHGVPDAKMFLILNDRLGGDWPVPPDASTVLPQYLDIDYVRVYSATSS
jgi:beta-glucanase (GH16 family)